MASVTEFIPVRVLQIVVNEADGHFLIVNVGQANFIDFLVQINEFGDAVTGLTADSQMRRMYGARSVVVRMA
jgi:hypothetical protein